MNESILNDIMKELKEIRASMATKDELRELRANVATELQEIRSSMATKDELRELRANVAAELQEIHSSMATKDELRELGANMATKDELRELGANMATKDELREMHTDLKRTMESYHIENISADEKLMELMLEIKQQTEENSERLTTHDHRIHILHRTQLYLETEIEKLKSR